MTAHATSRPAARTRSGPSASRSRRRTSTTSGGGSRRRAGPRRRPSPTDTQGVPLATAQELARYWANDYDFGRLETRLNAVPQFLTEIDGLDIHFIHVRSPHPNALPLIITHGWPGSIIEMLERHRPAHRPDGLRRRRGGRLRRGGPSMPGYGYSGKADDDGLGPRPYRRRLDRADAAPRLHALRRAGRRLGRPDHRRDRLEGAAGAARNPLQHARHGPARRLQGPHLQRLRDRPPGADRPVGRRAARLRPARFLFTKGVGYALEMGNRPQTLYGLADSPVGPRGLDARPRRATASRTSRRRSTATRSTTSPGTRSSTTSR